MSDGQLLYVIQPMTLDDIDQVMAIERQAFPLPWSRTTYQHELSDNQHSYYHVVRENLPPARPASLLDQLRQRFQRSPVLGYSGFWLVVDEAHISTIAVAKAWRGRGLGEFLLLHMIECGLELGANFVTLEVRVGNHVAQALYHKYGFVVTGRRKHYYRDNGEDAFIMTVEKTNSPAYLQRLHALRLGLWQRLQPAGVAPGQKARHSL